MTGQDRANHEKEEWGTVKNKKQTKAMGTDDPPCSLVGLVLCDDFKDIRQPMTLVARVIYVGQEEKKIKEEEKKEQDCMIA